MKCFVMQEEKEKLREEMKNTLSKLADKSIQENSQKVLENLWESNIISLFPVCCYISFGKEIETTNLIISLLNNGIEVVVPDMVDDKPVLCEFTGKEKIDFSDKFPRIKNPNLSKNNPEVFIVPGLAFAKDGSRLGRGVGFYDKLLVNYPNAKFIGICSSFQVKEQVPQKTHDIKMHYICTELGIFSCKH